MFLDFVLVILVVFTEPGGVSGRATRDTRNVRVSVAGIGLGTTDGSGYLRLLVGRATIKTSPLVVDTGGREVTGAFDLSGIPISGENVLGSTIGIDDGEEVRWPDGIPSSPGFGGVIRFGHWQLSHEMCPSRDRDDPAYGRE